MRAISPRLARRQTLLALAGALTTTLAAAPAARADRAFTCEASALRGSVLGAAPIEPLVANRGKDCQNTALGVGNLAQPLPGPLTANVLSAATVARGTADTRSAFAAGGVAGLGVGSLASLGLTLPAVPLPAIAPLHVDLPTSAIPPALALTLTGLGVTLPTSLDLDLSGAVQSLLKLPTQPLLSVGSGLAYAGASCADGAPVLAGRSVVAGVSVLGQDLGTEAVAEKPIVDTQSVDLSTVDPSSLTLPSSITSLSPTVQAAVRGVVDPLVAAALKAVPPIPVPITVAQVSLSPSFQLRSSDTLLQQGPRLVVTVFGQTAVALLLGEAKVGSAGVDCTPPAAPAPTAKTATASQSALLCTKRKLVLIDVLRSGDHVRLFGAADKKLVGRFVRIRFGSGKQTVARALVNADGSFRATAPLPSKTLRATNGARYQAVSGTERSLDLKLQRRMIVTRLAAKAGKVTIVGRVTRPLATPAQTITLTRRVSCSKSTVVKRFKPNADGTFAATVAAPKGLQSATYRLATKVRKTTRNTKLFPTFTLPRGVDLLK